jgi:uncharacterized protein YjbJ (UPF0337 family)
LSAAVELKPAEMSAPRPPLSVARLLLKVEENSGLVAQEDPVNADILKGQWKELQGKVRQQWGKLTDDDLATIKGDRDVLMGKIQIYYGRTRVQVQRDLDQWLEVQGIR